MLWLRRTLMRLGIKPEVRLRYQVKGGGEQWGRGQILDEKKDRYLIEWPDFWGWHPLRRTGWVLKGTPSLGRVNWPMEFQMAISLAGVFLICLVLAAAVDFGDNRYYTHRLITDHPKAAFMGFVPKNELGDGHFEVVGRTFFNRRAMVIRHDPGDRDFSYIVTNLSAKAGKRFRRFQGRIV